ncbi:DUF6816 family protein [Synechococcus sp. RSCCF101]|uniref:DUF6816 family protein n=1 Tax=Synechococcus sp. RSCCF101 TaxID=2511069 RepID=UPI001783F17A|nr:POLO box duplicated region [Synechococcus sp. RSCCF101]
MAALALAWLTGILLLLPQEALAAPPDLAARAAAWPDWQLPAPLQQPGQSDLVYPDWLAGEWQRCPAGPSDPCQRLRFRRDNRERVVGDRAFNALMAGRAVLGEDLLSVSTDPANPNRQLARLRGEVRLESSVIGRASRNLPAGRFLCDELALQVLHPPPAAGGDGTAPRVSRVETLTRLTPTPVDGESGAGGVAGPVQTVLVEQWQATYPSPSEGLAAVAMRSEHESFTLERLTSEPGPGPA